MTIGHAPLLAPLQRRQLQQPASPALPALLSRLVLVLAREAVVQLMGVRRLGRQPCSAQPPQAASLVVERRRSRRARLRELRDPLSVWLCWVRR